MLPELRIVAHDVLDGRFEQLALSLVRRNGLLANIKSGFFIPLSFMKGTCINSAGAIDQNCCWLGSGTRN
jgi:hypothetical protein